MGKRAKFAGLPVINLAAIHDAMDREKREVQTPLSSAQPNLMTEAKVNHSGAVANTTRRPWVAPRQDAPVCNYSRKARRAEPGQWTPEFKEEALRALRRDYIATSAKGPNASVLKTWEAMRHRMMGVGVPVYPLTVDKIAQVAAAFKICGYRSFSNYLSKAKEQHIQMYGEWPADLVLEAKRATRSVTRGIGPFSQRSRLEIERIMSWQRARSIDYQTIAHWSVMGPLTHTASWFWGPSSC